MANEEKTQTALLKAETFEEARAIYEDQANAYYFSEGTMEFFKSKIESGLIEDYYFITSERGPHSDSPRTYTCRKFSEDYKRIRTVGEFNQHKTYKKALETLKEHT